MHGALLCDTDALKYNISMRFMVRSTCFIMNGFAVMSIYGGANCELSIHGGANCELSIHGGANCERFLSTTIPVG
jgi:hypothetical protein